MCMSSLIKPLNEKQLVGFAVPQRHLSSHRDCTCAKPKLCPRDLPSGSVDCVRSCSKRVLSTPIPGLYPRAISRKEYRGLKGLQARTSDFLFE